MPRVATLAVLLLASVEAQAKEFRDALKDIPAGPFLLTVGGQLRLRFEYDDQFNVKQYAPGTTDKVLLERLMLQADLRLKKWARAFVELRDAHAFFTHMGQSDFPKANPFNDHLDIRQGYVEAFLDDAHPVGLKVGRQQISYGDQRVFGPGQWGNTGRWCFDAAMLILRNRDLKLDLWAARPVENRPDRWPNRWAAAPTLAVAYLQTRTLPLRLDLFYAMKYDGTGTVQGEAGKGNLLSHSIGFQLEGKAVSNILDYAGTFVYQFGRRATERLLAAGANVRLAATAPLPSRPRLAAQFTWGSGDRRPNDGTYGTFDGVLGGADIYFYGQMNLFFWANLRDYEADLHLHPLKGMEVRAEYHYFTLDQPKDAWYTTGLKALRRDQTGRSGRELGHELDLRATWTPYPGVELMLGYSHFFPGAFVQATGPAIQGNWVMVQTTVSL